MKRSSEPRMARWIITGTLRSPLADALVPILRHSNNSVADQVFLATGGAVAGAADRAGGLAATRRALERLGVSTDGLEQVDGSRLSRSAATASTPSTSTHESP